MQLSYFHYVGAGNKASFRLKSKVILIKEFCTPSIFLKIGSMSGCSWYTEMIHGLLQLMAKMKIAEILLTFEEIHVLWSFSLLYTKK